MSNCWLAAVVDISARRQVRPVDEVDQAVGDDRDWQPDQEDPQTVVRAGRARRALVGDCFCSHQVTTSMLPVMKPNVCMGPPNPSMKPPPHGTRHCQK